MMSLREAGSEVTFITRLRLFSMLRSTRGSFEFAMRHHVCFSNAFQKSATCGRRSGDPSHFGFAEPRLFTQRKFAGSAAKKEDGFSPVADYMHMARR